MNATTRQYLIDCEWMDAAEIRGLNRLFTEWLHCEPEENVSESHPGAFEAIGFVAKSAGLTLLHTSYDGDREDTRLYVSPRGRLVNAWVSGDALGFDDQPAGHEEE